MLGKLKEIFGPGGSSPAKGQGRRENLQRRFAIVSETSRGSMSRVYRALDNQTGRTVCLKIQSREKNEAADRAGVQPRGTSARGRDGDAARASPYRPDAGIWDSTKGEHFLVMEFIDGRELAVHSRGAIGSNRCRRSSCSRRPPKDWPPFMPPGLSTTTSIPGIFWSTAISKSS